MSHQIAHPNLMPDDLHPAVDALIERLRSRYPDMSGFTAVSMTGRGRDFLHHQVHTRIGGLLPTVLSFDDYRKNRISEALGRTPVTEEGEHADRVKLATIHATKGLEYPHVFLFWKEGLDRAPEIPHPADGCPLTLNKDDLTFLETNPIAGAAAIAEAASAVKEEKAEETANLLYVAATRASQSLTILLRADKEGSLKGFGELMSRTAQAAIPDAERTEFGWRHDYGPKQPRPADYEELTSPDLAGGPAAPADSDDMDPTLRSADIEAGIERGLRIHAALAQLTAGRTTFSLDHLTPEERAAIERFLSDAKVREILFRPGKVLSEQHLSDTRSFGIVDRLIIAPDRITLIDFKTGRVGYLAEKYRTQMDRYRAFLEKLFSGRLVEGYLLFVDEQQRMIASQ